MPARFAIAPAPSSTQMAIDTRRATAAISMLCQRPSVWLSGMTPLMRSIDVRQRRGRRHDERGRRRQAERPDAADAEVGGRADRAVVRAAHAMRDLAREQTR